VLLPHSVLLDRTALGRRPGTAIGAAAAWEPTGDPKDHFLFSFRLMVTALRESKELMVLVELEDP
jgi:hypothetical protein